MYWIKEDKLAYIKKYCKDIYEVVDDEYIVAYKSVRQNGCSYYNFQYQYETGQEYEAHCDCNAYQSNSFGLSAWSKEKAINYQTNNKVLKLHIDIDDIGVIIQEHDYKIRAKKIKVISEESI